MTATRLRCCRICGAPLESNYTGRRCGRCAAKPIRAAHNGRYVYQRTHIHEWPDGSLTVETGTTCGGTCS